MNTISSYKTILPVAAVLWSVLWTGAPVMAQTAMLQAKDPGQIQIEDSRKKLSVHLYEGWGSEKPLENAFITFSGSRLVGVQQGSAAEFSMDTLQAGEYTVAGIKDDEPLAGVSTLDLIRMSRHIMNIEPFTEPWQWVAADVNRSNTVTVFDIQQLQQLLLGNQAELPDNESYRFIDPDHAFPYPFPLEEAFSEQATFFWNPDQPKAVNLHLAAIKIGDVDGSGGMPAAESAPIRMSLPDVALREGETIDLDLRLADAEVVSGMQFALRFRPDALEILEVASGDLPNMDINNYSVKGRGELAMIWFDAFPHELMQGASLMRIRVRARKNLRLSEQVGLDANRLHPEMYAAEGEIHNLNLVFNRLEQE